MKLREYWIMYGQEAKDIMSNWQLPPRATPRAKISVAGVIWRGHQTREEADDGGKAKLGPSLPSHHADHGIISGDDPLHNDFVFESSKSKVGGSESS